MATITANPTSDEAVSGTWTGTANSRYTAVDDYPDSGGTDSLTCSAAGVLTFGFPAFSLPANAQITQVDLLYYDQKSGTQTSAIGGRLKVFGTYYNAATHNPANAVWTQRTDTWTTNPSNSKGWQVQDINGVGARPLTAFGFNCTDASPSVLVSSIQIQVTYTLIDTPGILVQRKPAMPGAATLNRRSPLAHGLKFLVGVQEGGGQPKEYLTGLAPSSQFVATQWDQSQAGTALLNASFLYTLPTPYTAVRPYTIFGVAQALQNTTNASTVFGLGIGTESLSSFIDLYFSSNSWQVYCDNNTSNAVVVTSASITFGNWYAVVATDDGTTPRMVIKDLTAGTVTTVTGTTFANANTVNGFGLGNDKYTQLHTGNIALGGYAARSWTQSEMLAWANDPFQLLRPATVPRTMMTQWLDAATGGTGSTYSHTLALALSGTLSDTVLLTLNPALTLQTLAQLSDSGPLTLAALSTALQAKPSLTPTGSLNMTVTQALAILAAQSQSGGLTYSGTVSLASKGSVTDAAAVVLSHALSLIVQDSWTGAVSRTLNPSISLAASDTLSISGNRTLAFSVALSALNAATMTAAISSTQSLSLGTSATVSDAAVQIMANATALGVVDAWSASATRASADAFMLGSTAALTAQATEVLGAALALAALSTATSTGGLAYTSTVTMPASGSLTLTAQEILSLVFALSSSSTQTTTNSRTASPSLSLATGSTLTAQGQNVMAVSLALAALSALTHAGGPTYTGSISLSLKAAETEAVARLLNPILALATASTLTDTASLTMSGATSLNAAGQVSDSGPLTSTLANALSTTAGFVDSGGLAYSQTIALSLAALLDLIGSRGFNGSVTLAAKDSLTMAGALTVAAAQALSTQAGMTASGPLVQGFLASLAVKATQSHDVRVTFGQSVPLASVSNLTPTGGFTLNSTITLSNGTALTLSRDAAVILSLALGAKSGLSEQASVVLGQSISLTVLDAISTQTQAVRNNLVSLGVNAALADAAAAIYGQSLALSVADTFTSGIYSFSNATALRIVAEQLKQATLTGAVLRRAGVTGESFATGSITDETIIH